MANKIKNWPQKAIKCVSGSIFGNFVAGVVWFFNFVGGTGYLFWVHQPQFAVADIIVSLFLLALSYAGMPDKD